LTNTEKLGRVAATLQNRYTATPLLQRKTFNLFLSINLPHFSQQDVIHEKIDVREKLEIFINGQGRLRRYKQEIFLNFSVINATNNMNMSQYQTAKSFCESRNETLPSSNFIVVEKDYKKKNIFWIGKVIIYNL